MIAFRKPYARYKDGVNQHAIVVYGTKPYSWGVDYDEKIHRLFIDLWLFVLYFEWLTHENKQDN